jgi:tetratricopeptide (TPR) repeat protein
MSRNSLSAIALAVALAAGSFSAPVALAGQDNKPTVSRAAGVPLKAAQEAAAAKKYDEAIAKAKEVIALQGATAYDRYVANQMLRFAYSQQGNIAGAAQAIEAEISSEFTPEQDKGKLMSALFGTYYNAKDYKQAIDIGQRMIKANVATGDTYVLIAQSSISKTTTRARPASWATTSAAKKRAARHRPKASCR